MGFQYQDSCLQFWKIFSVRSNTAYLHSFRLCIWKYCEVCVSTCCITSLYVQFSHSVVSNSLPPDEPQHAWPPCPSPTPGVHWSSCPLSQWCHPTIFSSVIPFSCLQSFPTSRSFQMSQLFASGGQNIGVSASTSMNTQDWFPLGLASLISWQSEGLSRVFSNTTVQKH